MPYIAKEKREDLYTEINLLNQDIETIGQLNYVITTLCLKFLQPEQASYADYNQIIGVLECVKQEFYRRACAPYEDKKKEENGDVFTQV